MLKWVRRQGIEVGIFCALHTDGRQLNQHPHIHVSVTRGGLDVKHDVCSKRRPLRKSGGVSLSACCAAAMSGPAPTPCRDWEQWRRYLKAQYGRHCKVHFAKNTRGT
ncbi:transposase [Erwinia tracheiphila]|nr:transposase [Erwinia tracheiphila]